MPCFFHICADAGPSTYAVCGLALKFYICTVPTQLDFFLCLKTSGSACVSKSGQHGPAFFPASPGPSGCPQRQHCLHSSLGCQDQLTLSPARIERWWEIWKFECQVQWTDSHCYLHCWCSTVSKYPAQAVTQWNQERLLLAFKGCTFSVENVAKYLRSIPVDVSSFIRV
jgi:hypothetical protein